MTKKLPPKCANCKKRITEGQSAVAHEPTNRIWHVGCAPIVPPDEQGKRIHLFTIGCISKVDTKKLENIIVSI